MHDIQQRSTGIAQAAPVAAAFADNNTQPPDEVAGSSDTTSRVRKGWEKWYGAFKAILPVYIATHIAFLVLTYLSSLFLLGNFSPDALPSNSLLHSWNRWDTGHFLFVATKGYDAPWRTAFFPLYPLLVRGLIALTNQPFISGLLVSNLAALVMFTTLYLLVKEDFDQERAYRTVLYLAIFPTAFFFAAAYNESLFLCLTFLSFYHMRRSQWWWAGLFGLLAGLTRSAGLLLLIPFTYEYLRQHSFSVKNIRFDVISGALIVLGTALFALYSYLQFHDALAFSHAQSVWHRQLHMPWRGYINASMLILHSHFLTFDSIHNVIDMSAGLLMLALTVLCFVGPWRFPKAYLSYGLYAVTVYLFLTLFPASGTTYPLQSLSRLVLEIFPAFIVIAAMGKHRQFNLYYVTISLSVLAFMLLQFLTGHWIV